MNFGDVKITQTSTLREDQNDANEFKSLKDAEEDSLRAQIISKRTGISHEKAAACTPEPSWQHEPEWPR